MAAAFFSEEEKTVVIATKTNQETIYEEKDKTVIGIPHRTPVYITKWQKKYETTDKGGAFDASKGVFTAKRDATFTATFTFALENGRILSNSVDTNQIEAIWRVYDENGKEINTVKCANAFPSDSRQNQSSSGDVKAGSNCTGSIFLRKGQKIRPAVWIDLDPDKNKMFDLSKSNGNSLYNNLTIVEN